MFTLYKCVLSLKCLSVVRTFTRCENKYQTDKTKLAMIVLWSWKNAYNNYHLHNSTFFNTYFKYTSIYLNIWRVNYYQMFVIIIKIMLLFNKGIVAIRLKPQIITLIKKSIIQYRNNYFFYILTIQGTGNWRLIWTLLWKHWVLLVHKKMDF